MSIQSVQTDSYSRNRPIVHGGCLMTLASSPFRTTDWRGHQVDGKNKKPKPVKKTKKKNRSVFHIRILLEIGKRASKERVEKGS